MFYVCLYLIFVLFFYICLSLSLSPTVSVLWVFNLK